MSRDTQPTPVKEVTVRNYKPVYALSDETLAFTATIYLDGKRAGVASNQGHGAPNRYDFADREQYQAFLVYAEKWGQANEVTVEAADALIGALCEEYELRNQARRLLNLRSNTVILVEKGPVWFTDDHSGKPVGYEERQLVVVADGKEPATLASELNADAWRVISTD